MDNQHTKIKGYRDLSQTEINAMNAVKLKAVEVGDLMQELLIAGSVFDERWLSIAKTNLQIGFMAAVRAIAKPTTF